MFKNAVLRYTIGINMENSLRMINLYLIHVYVFIMITFII